MRRIRHRAGRIAAAIGMLALLLGAPSSSLAQGESESAFSAQLALGALGLVGAPYRYGGSDPATGLDCSGLVQYVVGNVLGLQLPRQTEAMSLVGTAVERDALRAGDLVFFNTLGRPFSHVGVYVDEGQFVHAPATRGRVRVESTTQPYWAKRYNGARRLAPHAVHARADRLPADRGRNEPPSSEALGLDKP